jgi:hypothetical protein
LKNGEIEEEKMCYFAYSRVALTSLQESKKDAYRKKIKFTKTKTTPFAFLTTLLL